MVWGFCYLRIFKKVQSISGRSLDDFSGMRPKFEARGVSQVM
jgi:hypothetical protein